MWRRDEPRVLYVAKRIRQGSRELDILEFLKKTEPRSQHVITLVESIQSLSETWLILPKLQPISTYSPCSSAAQALQFSRDLVEGLGHLHKHMIAHMDVKPANLAFDKAAQCLVLLDLDTAIMLEDENAEVVGYRGTEEWTAPELGDADADEDKEEVRFKPILADLWACGRVIDFFFGDEEEDHPLRPLTRRLAASPGGRPSMKECLKWIELHGKG